MDQRIQDGRTVCLDYSLSLTDGTVIDSAEKSGTWTYVHGHTKMPPGLAKGIAGLQVGDQVRLDLAPEDAFGAANPDAFHEVPKPSASASVLKVGYAGEMPGPNGTIITYRIHAINEETVTLDLNHPLAGEHVIFDVTVIHIQD
ncbi:FKBP-type peptidyl-prolyl cis-trans isomerase [Candidatus Entotheonella palauensis]|uniref:FKBP-type peptidyl-prolyl cis-trans isomerase n=1 Tax=Candidatus Entotheonella palauensis TaxID=93172 RepID=UPI000B7D1919|nr:FKBP-type peptidyl-prolyl cis-trans isomerase [Candidatus Entotheonella palauensis]